MGYLQHPATDSLPYPRGRNGTTGQAEPLKHKNRKANPKGWLFFFKSSTYPVVPVHLQE